MTPKTRKPKITGTGLRRGALIKTHRDRLEESQETFGKRFNVKQTTVGRWEIGWPVDQEHWPAMSRLLQMTQSDLFLEKPEDGFLPDTGHRAGQLETAWVPVLGDAIQGAWVDAEEHPAVSQLLLDNGHLDSSNVLLTLPPIGIVPDARYRGMNQFAVRVPGTSMNKKIPDGGYVVCVPYWDVRTALTDGDMVLAERRRPGQYQITVKRLRRVNGGWELQTESTDPKWKDPIKLVGDTMLKEKDTSIETEVVIVGKVIWIGSEP